MKARPAPANVWLLAALLVTVPGVAAQDPDAPDTAAEGAGAPADSARTGGGEARGASREATAVRVPSDAIRLDGRLDEDVWQGARPATDFVQKEPVEGAEPTERTEVRFVYDDDALYIGARMHVGRGAAGIQAPLQRRDRPYSAAARERSGGGGAPGGGRDAGGSASELADYVLVSMDTYLDRRTAYTFGVTASGVRFDHQHLSDSETDIDPRFDPVWEAEVSVDAGGWSAEMWIPWSQLRFTEGPRQVWGLNIHRWIPARNEDDYWVLIPRTEDLWASRFGRLRGIRGIDVSTRLELLPYATGGSTLNEDADPANPFDDGLNLEGRVGGDLKMGVGPNLTLDGTVVPDFGQVEVDPAVINLTADEIFFPERRPFFTEGSSLLEGPRPNYFYSRRIGAPPTRRPPGDFADMPRNTTILGAAKLTGRLPSGTSLGFLGAVTEEEHARTFDVESGSFDDVRVEPRTAWGVARVQQEWGPSGSTASLMFTGVHRNLDDGTPLARLLHRNALTGHGAVLWRPAAGAYEIEVSGGATYVDGTAEAILRTQRGSERYFQRPDADHVALDPDRTSMTGGKFTVEARKLSGAHWLWDLYFDIESPEVSFNDIGRLTWADGIQNSQGVTYRETEPGETFRSYRIRLGETSEWTFGGDRQQTSLSTDLAATWRNFWTTSLSTRVSLPAQDHRLTRGGPSVGTPLSWSQSVELANNAAERTRWRVSGRYGEDELGGMTWGVSGDVSLVPAPRWQVSVGPSVERRVDPRQWVTRLGGGRPATFGDRYVFAFVDRTELAVEARLNFTLKPDVNLELFAQPFAASGRFYDFGEVDEPGELRLRRYGTGGTTVELLEDGSREVTDGGESFVIPDQDFNVRSLRSTAVLRWEWTPGSTLYLVWQQDRSDRRVIGERAGPDDLLGSLTTAGSNFFAIKASYWIGP